jgi:hypothetical protein
MIQGGTADGKMTDGRTTSGRTIDVRTVDGGTIAAAFDQTIVALSHGDLLTLQELERRIGEYRGMAIRCDSQGARLLTQKRRQLEILLENCAVNLATLERLHGRDGREPWVR